MRKGWRLRARTLIRCDGANASICPSRSRSSSCSRREGRNRCTGDVGSWSALYDVLAGDANDHRVVGGGAVASTESSGCVVFGPEGHVTALVGVKDLVVVQAGRATLVCPRDRAQEVRAAVEQIRTIDPTLL